MQVTLDKQNETLAYLTISIEEADYKAGVDATVKDYSKKANIKGFRPGKVPAGVVMSMMGESIVADEVMKLLSSTINNYIKENNLSIIGDPIPAEEEKSKVINWKSQKEFEFKYEVGLVPEFEFDLAKVKVDKYDIEIEDKTFEETKANIIKQSAATNNPEEATEEDFVSGDLEQIDGDFKAFGMIELPKVAPMQRKKFLGAKKDEEVTFDLQKAFAKNKAELKTVTGLELEEAEKLEGEFKITIKHIVRYENPEMNQEFFDKVLGEGKVSTEEEFDAELRKLIDENFNRDAEMFVGREIQDEIISSTNIDYSEEFFKKWILEANKDKITREALEKDFANYEKELKWNLIQSKIAEQASIKVEEHEVKEMAYANLMQQFGGQQIPEEMMDQFKQYAEKQLMENNGQGYMQTFNQVMHNKVITHAREVVAVNDKKIQSEAFKELVTSKN